MSRAQDLRDLNAVLRHLVVLAGPKRALAMVRGVLIEAERDGALRGSLAARLTARFGPCWRDVDPADLNDDDVSLWETGALLFDDGALIELVEAEESIRSGDVTSGEEMAAIMAARFGPADGTSGAGSRSVVEQPAI